MIRITSPGLSFRIFLLLLVCWSCSTQKSLVHEHPDEQQESMSPRQTVDLSSLALDRKMSRQLEDFQQGGVERKLDMLHYKPDDLIDIASEYMGTKHCMGGTSSQCLDCSGLIFLAFQRLGIAFPRVSEEQARYGRIVSKRNQLKRGDLVFFVRTYQTAHLITHVGIYLGDSQFIHTSSSRGVMISSVDDPNYWHDKFIFATRLF